ncbi:MAG: DUF4129 domain-containing protein [Actinobacteria bacterium]|nr:MAG: DUF4129 domain-containing protein [Actinomycetota bacterium]
MPLRPRPRRCGRCARRSACPSTSISRVGRSMSRPTACSTASGGAPPRTSTTPTTTWRRWKMPPGRPCRRSRPTPLACRRRCAKRCGASAPSPAYRVPLPHGLLVSIAAGILAVVVVVLIRRLGYIVPERRAAGDGPGRQGKPDWDRLAREAMARGDLVEAVRARYGALLAALAGRGIVPDTPSLTAGECRRAVAGGLPGAYPVVAKATTIFESVMYGRAEATAGGVDTLAAAERSVKAA